MNRNLRGALIGAALALALSFAPLALAAELAAELTAEVGGDAAAPGDFELDSEWPYVDELTVINCTVSGRGPGTIVIVPADGTWYIEVDTFFGETLTARRVILVLEGEAWRAYHNGQLFKSGVGKADCGGDTTTTTVDTTTTTAVVTTTTFDGVCDEVECPSTTTTEAPPVTTTSIPGQPDDDGNCPPGTELDPSGLACFVGGNGVGETG